MGKTINVEADVVWTFTFQTTLNIDVPADSKDPLVRAAMLAEFFRNSCPAEDMEDLFQDEFEVTDIRKIEEKQYET